jgi:hypothetical protein
MAQKLYVVTTGEHGDYQIRGIFDDLAKATIFRAALKTISSIEDWQLNAMPKWADLGMDRYQVMFNPSGDVLWANTNGALTTNDEVQEMPTASRCHNGSVSVSNIWADSREKAFKIASEKRAQCLAELAHQ